ncbi:hypothetical protein DFH08DRAFT_1051589 [Mycena albidolilacea]|uniref:Uncharacterized protein n=1 Tax=Mycena albidolilacea TaxID=1033008 RepID=A0AAD7EAJ5_9AGAR|nr:hypothetical protein DFH08DRAFT_1051589 [Mycena albidolilacea]
MAFFYFRRIETDIRPLVRSAMQSSIATVRAQYKKGSAPSESTPSFKSAPTTNSKSNNAHSKSTPKSSSAADGADPKPAPPPIDKHASRPKEFARTSSAAPRRLNDIAQAPPELSSFARKKSSTNTPVGKAGGKSTKASILSPAQQLAMAAGREDAVQRYRVLKASRHAAEGGDGGERGGGAVGEGEGDELTGALPGEGRESRRRWGGGGEGRGGEELSIGRQAHAVPKRAGTGPTRIGLVGTTWEAVGFGFDLRFGFHSTQCNAMRWRSRDSGLRNGVVYPDSDTGTLQR